MIQPAALSGGSDAADDLAVWLRFVNDGQALVTQLQLDPSETSSILSGLFRAAATLHLHATALLARSNTTARREPLPGRPAGAEPPDAGRGGVLDFRVRAVLEHVNAGHFDRLRLLADLARNLRVSPSYLSRLVAHQTGTPYSRHVQVQRMIESARLLQETDLSVKEIASAAGYEHVPSFDRQFRQFFHSTPTEYRRHVRRQPLAG